MKKAQRPARSQEVAIAVPTVLGRYALWLEEGRRQNSSSSSDVGAVSFSADGTAVGAGGRKCSHLISYSFHGQWFMAHGSKLNSHLDHRTLDHRTLDHRIF